MKILLSADCFYPAQMGGPSNTIYWHAKALKQAGYEVTVVADSQYLPASVPLGQWITLDCGQVMYTRNPFFYLPLNHIRQGWMAIRKADIVHVNSLFYPASLVWVLMSRLVGKPVVWSPHGELSPVALRFRPRLKRVFLTISKRLRLTVQFHATSATEVTHIQQHFGTDARVSEIRSIMELPTFLTPKPVDQSAQPYLLFIGRLHPIKAIDRLISALGSSRLFRESQYSLKIAGPETDKAYTQTLTELVQTLGLSTKVSFIGQVQGHPKECLYANAWLTILPSHSENFGNVVIESLAQGTPVVASIHTPWQLLERERTGSWVSNEPDTLREAIETYLRMPLHEYTGYRERAIRLAQQQFSIATTTEEWNRLYGQLMHAPTAVDFHNTIAAEFNRKYESSKAFRERFQVWTGLFDRYVNPLYHVIDLGCGPGVFSDYLAHKGCIVTGVDGSEAMIELCQQKKTLANVQYILQSLPLTSLVTYAPQDVVLLSSVLEYVDDMKEILEQAYSLLKPNGLLIVSIPNRTSVYRIIERLLFRLLKRPGYFAYIRHTATKAGFNRQLNELGFEPLETAYFSGQDPISRLIKPIAAERYVNNLLVGVYRKRTG
ncbi:glycosyltransferase [Spirosoma sp. KCTC 42546]|uniref:glycosyltransferase n=1 Tax=Spirosoma sp. KCTC 42546 TaxID=2520506 RepID=UPI00115839A8|nr:glycosyltransferase [Spirosoma sp. KCTC 42546]QDK82605.1 glycosyltransferase [Spirosoma sp. KCTC 42546]